jgi:DNA-binding MarR family transcriptional regulator
MNDLNKYYPHNCPAYLTGIVDRYLRERIVAKFQKAGYNISGEQWHILMFLYLNNGLSQKELCQLTGKSKVSIVKTIHLLEANNLAVRIQSENDLRYKRVYLTHKGKKLEAELLALVKESSDGAFKGLSNREMEDYKKTLRKILDNK